MEAWMKWVFVAALPVVVSLLACTGEATVAPAPEPQPDEAPAEEKGRKSKQGKSGKAKKEGHELDGYQGRFKGDPKLDEAEVAMVPDDALAELRNEVFAQYGRPFNTDAMKDAFAKKPWYSENPDFSDDWLTANDKANVALIQSFESKDGNKKETAAKLKVAEYAGEGRRLVLNPNGNAEIIEGGDDVYNWEPNPQQWVAKGDWVLTFSNGQALAKADEVWLWKLDDAKRKVVNVDRVKP